MLSLFSAVVAAVAVVNSASTEVEVDLSRIVGAVRPLNGICNSVPLQGVKTQRQHDDMLAQLAELHLPYTRFHDAPLESPGFDLVDISRIFPLAHADLDDPRNFNFGPTDDYVADCLATGTKIEFRFGETIELSRKHYKICVPDDIARWVEICMRIARHYRDAVESWSIWEEPNNKDLLSGTNAYPEVFLKMYVTLAKRLKQEFPDKPVGGCALIPRMKDVEAFLVGCRQAGAPLDFFSYTSYNWTVKGFDELSRSIKAALVKHGYGEVPLRVAEWHRYKSLPPGMSRGSMLIDMNAVGMQAGVLSVAQDMPVDRLYFYAAYLKDWGLFEGGRPRPIWHVFRAYRDFREAGARAATEIRSDEEGWHALAARSADGKGLLMVSGYDVKAGPVTVVVKGGFVPREVRQLTEKDGFRPIDGWTFADGRLALPHPAAGGVVWLIRF